MSLDFLNTKSFHPSTWANQKRVWVAQQAEKDRAEKEKLAAEEYNRRMEEARDRQLVTGKKAIPGADVLSFMYAAPAGLKEAQEREREEAAGADAAEDDAVRAFNKKIQLREAGQNQWKLEKAAGKVPSRAHPDFKEMVKRFPMLKNAPVEGSFATDINVTFAPMGKIIRNVKCMRCEEWGHRSGDRECPMRDHNPNDVSRKIYEDPLAAIRMRTGRGGGGAAGGAGGASGVGGAGDGGGGGGAGGTGGSHMGGMGINMSSHEEMLLDGMSRKEKKAMLRRLESGAAPGEAWREVGLPLSSVVQGEGEGVTGGGKRKREKKKKAKHSKAKEKKSKKSKKKKSSKKKDHKGSKKRKKGSKKRSRDSSDEDSDSSSSDDRGDGARHAGGDGGVGGGVTGSTAGAKEACVAAQEGAVMPSAVLTGHDRHQQTVSSGGGDGKGNGSGGDDDGSATDADACSSTDEG